MSGVPLEALSGVESMIPSLKIEIIWADNDMLEIQLSISNESFAGHANFYAALNEPASFAKKIDGFPRTSGDIREHVFGNFNIEGYGGAELRFSCRDGSGHSAVRASVHMNPIGSEEVGESATVQLNLVPAAIDLFVEELQKMKSKVGAVAILKSEA